MQPKYSCPKCGNLVQYGIPFCVTCGTPLNWPAQQQMPPQQMYQQQWNYQQSPSHQQYGHQGAGPYKKGTSPLLVIFITIVILAVLCGISYLAYDSFLKEPQATPPEEPPVAPQTPQEDDQSDVDIIAPVITDISVSPTEDSAVITWTTDETATSRVEYGESTDYIMTSALDDNLSNNHSITIDNLDSDTLYHFRVISKDNVGNETVSEDDTFNTLQIVLERSAEIISHNLDWGAGGNYVWGIVKNTGEVDIKAKDIKILIVYESYVAEDQSFQKGGSVNSEPEVIEPNKYTEFSIPLEVINVKPDYDISLTLKGE